MRDPSPGRVGPEDWARFADWSRRFEVTVSPSAQAKMEQYLEILLDWNTRLNLSAVRDPGEVLIKHFLDSLTILRHLPPEAPLLDIGTGAGFPGLVVKILRPDQPVTLAESRAKKVGFLEHVRRTLALRECSILHQRVIPGDPALVGQFGAVVSRAFQSLEPFIELAHPFLQPGGRVIAMLGRALPGGEKGVQALASASGATLTALEQFALPLGAGERHIVVLEWTEARCST